jgi:type VI secretion system protein ImpF
MAGPRRADILRHSVLDRLVGTEEGPPRGGDLRIGIDDLRRVIRRDLEWLLNSRLVVPEDWFSEHEEASKSILAFGLSDLSPFSLASARDSQSICELITKAVRAFEPRLARRSIKTEFLPASDVTDFQMHFRISAMIHVDPISEPVSFDTALDRSSGCVTVREGE